MSKLTRETALERVRANIARYGYHVYTVSGGDPLPRYAYTIGLSERVGAEVILAGAIFFMAEDVRRVIDTIAAELNPNKTSYTVESLGCFSLYEADLSWTGPLMLGAADYYGNASVRARQIVPDTAHWTLDIPDMRKPWSASQEPVWQWMNVPWTLPVSAASTVVTNLSALRGNRITEAARWEEDQWEIFAGSPETTPENEIRVVPLGTLLGIDPSLHPASALAVGDGICRDPDNGEWVVWE